MNIGLDILPAAVGALNTTQVRPAATLPSQAATKTSADDNNAMEVAEGYGFVASASKKRSHEEDEDMEHVLVKRVRRT